MEFWYNALIELSKFYRGQALNAETEGNPRLAAELIELAKTYEAKVREQRDVDVKAYRRALERRATKKGGYDAEQY